MTFQLLTGAQYLKQVRHYQAKAGIEMDASVQTLRLRVRSWNCLVNEFGYGLTLDAICAARSMELLKIPNLSRGGLNDIKNGLAEVGRYLADDGPIPPMTLKCPHCGGTIQIAR